MPTLGARHMFRSPYDAVGPGNRMSKPFSRDCRPFHIAANGINNDLVPCLRSRTIAGFYLLVSAVGAARIMYMAFHS
jgi:hypothetical protein